MRSPSDQPHYRVIEAGVPNADTLKRQMESDVNAPQDDNDLPAAESVEFAVPFHDCDPLFVVWHGNYLKYFELARTALFQRLNLDVPNIRDLGFKMFVTESRCRYLFPLTYNDRVRVTARITRLEPTMRISFRVENLTQGRRSARAYTDLATTDFEGTLLSELPEVLRERIR